MTVTKKLRDLIRAFIEKHERRPNVILISPHDELEFHDELPDPLKSEAFVKGVRAVLKTFDGISIRWDAKQTSVASEDPLPPFIKG